MSDNPERVLFPFHLGGPRILTADKQFSKYVSRTLDCLGKNQDMIKYRVKVYKEIQELNNIIDWKNPETIIAGSKSEGLTSIFESDQDNMIINSYIICADNVQHFIHTRNTILFETDKYDSPAGYTKLKVKYKLSNHSLIQVANGVTYLSSDLVVTTLLREHYNSIERLSNVIFYERSGPSLPTSDLEGYHHDDHVLAFRYICPPLLQKFLTRRRPHNRPSRNELRDISVMEAHVVHVGHKGSDTSHLEWRICFTNAEIYLIQRLNDTETKLYILLKMVSKLCKLFSKDITSYVMKNIVLWMVELYPKYLFIEELLTQQLIQALRFFKKCVEVNNLPSYMIPERNLFAERLNPVQKLKLTTFLSTIIQERGYLLLRCEKIRYGIRILHREPDMAEEFRRRRDMAEKLHLLEDIIVYEKRAATGLSEKEVNIMMHNDGTSDKITIALIKVVCPDMKFLIRHRRSTEAFAVASIIIKRLQQLLS